MNIPLSVMKMFKRCEADYKKAHTTHPTNSFNYCKIRSDQITNYLSKHDTTSDVL